MPLRDPDRNLENALAGTAGLLVAGVDEVGRGAAAGPVVCAALISGAEPAPAGIRDSKLLSAARRATLEPAIKAWAGAWGIRQATPEEIDSRGMTAALGLAARRALHALAAQGPVHVLLDGPFDSVQDGHAVTPQPKADLTCLCVAAASVLAKEHRDRLMRTLAVEHDEYHLDVNAGYLSPAHLAALREHGPIPGLHRLSWKYVDSLPGFEHLRVHPNQGQQLTLL